MNENINLCEILKDCPKGTKFYSPLMGELSFSEILLDNACSIRLLTSDNNDVGFFPNGRYTRTNTECLLFPSKDQRDWSKWECKFDPKSLQPFDKVLARDYLHGKWTCGFFSHIVIFDNIYMYNIGEVLYKMCIPYNDETKHLVGTDDEAPEYYRY